MNALIIINKYCSDKLTNNLIDNAHKKDYQMRQKCVEKWEMWMKKGFVKMSNDCLV